MDATQYRRALRIKEDVEQYGFVVTVRDHFIFVGIDPTHDLWQNWGLVTGNTLSGAMSSMEEAEAWMDGFLAFQQYLRLATPPDSKDHAKLRKLVGVDP